MKKYLAGFLLAGAVVLSGCSSDDGLAGGGVPENGNTTTRVVKSSGVVNIPLVVPKGTSFVKVVYQSGGAEKSFEVPFVQTSSAANSSMVSGHATVYSVDATSVDVYAGGGKVAESVTLPGRSTVKAEATPATDTQVEAYFFLRVDGDIPGADIGNSNKYYPQTSNGGSYFGDINRGKLETDFS